MKYTIGTKTLTINLPKDINVTTRNSAQGKTYVYKLLSGLLESNSEYKKQVLLVNNISSKEEYASVLSALEKGGYSLVVFDRADRYMTSELMGCLLKIQGEGSAVVLLDLKNWNSYLGLYPSIYEIQLNSPKEVVLNVAYDF